MKIKLAIVNMSGIEIQPHLEQEKDGTMKITIESTEGPALRAALKEAQETICSEFCTHNGHKEICSKYDKLLAVKGAGND